MKTISTSQKSSNINMKPSSNMPSNAAAFLARLMQQKPMQQASAPMQS